MQDCFVGDVGDFGKYGLLRAICGITISDGYPPLSLGVMWYLVPNEDGASDGKFISYLTQSHPKRQQFRQCDPALYDAFSKVVFEEGRCVANVARAGILGRDAVFHEEPLSYEDLPWKDATTKRARLARREDWFERGLRRVAGCEVIFLDPDNGLECMSVECHHAKGPKYAYLDDLRKIREAHRGRTLVVYHHLCRKKAWPHSRQIEHWRGEIARQLDADAVHAARFRRGNGRAFLIIPSQRHRDIISRRLDSFKASTWCQYGHFECF